LIELSLLIAYAARHERKDRLVKPLDSRRAVSRLQLVNPSEGPLAKGITNEFQTRI